MSLRGAAKAQLAAAVAAEASAQVGDDMINQEGELDEQYVLFSPDITSRDSVVINLLSQPPTQIVQSIS